MKEKKGILIILITIIALVAIGVLLSILLNLGNKIPENDPSLSGTTAGNQYHGGLFCEKDGLVYFANAYDSNSLYCMQPDQSNIVKLTTGEIYYINAAGDYIYYYSRSTGGEAGLGYMRSGRGIYRCTTDGKSVSALNQATCDGLLLLGNSLYYTDYAEGAKDTALVTLHSMDLYGKEDILIANGHPQLGSIADSTLYYSSMEGNYTLCSYYPATGALAIAGDIGMYQPIIQDGMIYYIDIRDNYKLKSYSLYTENVQTIVDERIDSFNVLGNIIYYQNCDPNNYALMRIYTDGTGNETVRSGVYRNINITSEYVYFTEFSNDLPVYQTPTYGPVNVSTFDAAFRAAAGMPEQ